MTMRIVTICLILCLFTIYSCYEPSEGCTNVLATNYEASADESCDDECCTFPELKLTVSHKHGENTLSFDSIYTNELGQAYSFKFIQLYLYNARLIRDNGESIAINQSVLLNPGEENEVEIIDDLISFRPSSFRFEFGEWIGTGEFTSLAFSIGIPPSIDSSTFVTEESHPINNIGDSLVIDNDKYAPAYISLDTIPNSSYFNVRLLNEVEVTISDFRIIDRGFDVTFELDVDYSQWFKEVDFSSTEEEIRSKVSTGSQSLFVLR